MPVQERNNLKTKNSRARKHLGELSHTGEKCFILHVMLINPLLKYYHAYTAHSLEGYWSSGNVHNVNWR